MITEPLKEHPLLVQHRGNRVASRALQVVVARKLRERIYMDEASDRSCVRFLRQHYSYDRCDDEQSDQEWQPRNFSTRHFTLLLNLNFLRSSVLAFDAVALIRPWSRDEASFDRSQMLWPGLRR